MIIVTITNTTWFFQLSKGRDLSKEDSRKWRVKISHHFSKALELRKNAENKSEEPLTRLDVVSTSALCMQH